MLTNQAMLAIAAVAGFRFGGPVARQVLGNVPGLPAAALSPDVAGAVGAVAAFMILKRVFLK